jgi:hypothetical protein
MNNTYTTLIAIGLAIAALMTTAHLIERWREKKRLEEYYGQFQDKSKVPPIYIDHMDR